MNTCDTCRHWKIDPYSAEWLRYCAGDLIQRSGFFFDGKYTPGPGDNRKDQIVATGGVIRTHAKFGCVHWEPKGLQV